MRPGPLQAGLNVTYAEGKNENKITETIRGCEEVLGPTYGALVYQEQLNILAV